MSFWACHWHTLVNVSIAQHLGKPPSAPLLLSEQGPAGLGLSGQGRETVRDGASVRYMLTEQTTHSKSLTSEMGLHLSPQVHLVDQWALQLQGLPYGFAPCCNCPRGDLRVLKLPVP